eukprot:12891635-Prorocentrum_lima.AAC.1
MPSCEATVRLQMVAHNQTKGEEELVKVLVYSWSPLLQLGNLHVMMMNVQSRPPSYVSPCWSAGSSWCP